MGPTQSTGVNDERSVVKRSSIKLVHFLALLVTVSCDQIEEINCE